MTIPAPWISQLTRTFVRKNNLSPSDLDVAHVQSPIFISVADPETGDKNMKATFLFKHGNGNYSGSELFTYQTVNLNKLFVNNTVPVVWGYNPHTTKEIAKLLIDSYGLPLHEDWFVDEPVDGSILPMHFTIKTKATDWCSAGEITVRMEQSENDVAELFAVDVLDAPNYIKDTPYAGKSTLNYVYATYGKDFTPRYIDENKELRSFQWTIGSVTIVRTVHTNAPSFISLLKDVLGNDAIVSSYSPDFGKPDVIFLPNMAVIYNGPTKGMHSNGEPLSKYATCDNITADTSYDNVLIAKTYYPDGYGNAYYSAPMFIHYNDV